MGRDELRDRMLIKIASRIRILAKHRVGFANISGRIVGFCERASHEHAHIRPNPVISNDANLLADISIGNE